MGFLILVSGKSGRFSLKVNFLTLILILFFTLVLQTCVVFGESATITKQSGGLYFTGNSNDPSTLYQDGIDGNLDVGVRLCDAGGQRYVGAFYAVRVQGTWKYVLVSYNPASSSALSFTDVSSSEPDCYETTPGLLTISPSQLTVTDPDVYMAAFPARLWIGYSSTSENPGTVSNFVFGDNNAVFRGYYSVTRTFDQLTKKISIGVPTVTFQTTGGSFSKSLADATFGLNDKRKIAIGICNDENGFDCSDGEIFSAAAFPDFDTGLVSVDDQMTYTKYVVINGLGNPLCIGPNLRTSVQSVTPNPVYYSQTLNISFSISNPRDTPYEINGGNVDVTTNFIVNVKIYNKTNPSQVIYEKNIPISNTIIPDGSVTLNLEWPAYAKSGFYTVLVTVDSDDDIAECNEGDNSDSRDFELKPIVLPEIYIDGEQNDTFPYPNQPYKLDFHFKNSDDKILKNSTVLLFQVNGLSLCAPSQVFNLTIDDSNNTIRSGLTSTSIISFVTDYYGNSSFTFIPTYNKLYEPEYAYLNYSDAVGNYSLYFEGNTEEGEPFNFIIDGKLTNQYPLKIANVSGNDLSDKDIYHKNLVSQSFNFVYHLFTNFLESVLR